MQNPTVLLQKQTNKLNSENLLEMYKPKLKTNTKF